jgi:hypothetical protein
MACVHLQQLYQLCQDHDLKLGGSDLIRVFCHQCGEQEVCPSMLIDESDSYESQPNSTDQTKSKNENAS